MARSHTQPCFAPAVLQEFLAETLDESHEARVQTHLDGCSTCQATLERVAGEPEEWSQVREHLAHEPGTLPGPETGPHELEEWKALLDRSDDPDKLGRIGVYEIVGLIGRGTTGLVWKAYEPRLHRFVAIKILAPAYKANGSARQRFAREGRAVAAVTHEHVVPVYAVDDHRGLPYIVMQYIPGLSLEQRIQRDGPLDACEVTRIGLQVAQGLAAAHEQGIIHRDVKPANVILEDTVDRAMVTDFGLARVADEASMTSSGTISGTPHYMSPEQARGQTVDQRSDLFSLGSLLYATCAGRPPFRAENVFGVIHRVCKTEARPIHEIQPGVAPWLEAFIAKLMAKDPAQRFANATDVVSALSQELAYLQNPASAPQPDRSWLPADAAPVGGERQGGRRWGFALTGVLVASLGAWAMWAQPWVDSPPSEDQAGAETLTASFMPSLPVFLGREDPQRSLAEPVPLGEGWTRRDPQNEGAGEPTPLPVFEHVAQTVLDLQGQTALDIHLPKGHISVRPREGNQVRMTTVQSVATENLPTAQARLAGSEFLPERTADHLTIRAAEGSVSPTHQIAITLEVPPHFAANIVSEEGNVSVEGLLGDVRARTRGHLRAGRLAAGIDLRTEGGHIDFWGHNSQKAQLLAIGGNIHVHGANAGARARTSNGHVYVGRNAGEVYAQTSGGNVFVQELQGWVGGHAGGGHVYLLATETPGDSCRLSAAGGNVYVLLGREAAGTLQVRGQVDSDLVFTTETPTDGSQPFQSLALNGGGPTLQFSSPAGRVVIDRLDALHQAAPMTPRMAQAIEAGGKAPAPPASDQGPSPSDLPQSPAQPVASSESSDSTEPTTPSPAASQSGRSTPSQPKPGLGGSAAPRSLGGSGSPPTQPSLGGSGAATPSSLGGSRQTPASPVPDRPLRTTPPAPGRLSDSPAPGKLATVHLDNPTGNIDGYTLYLPRTFHQERAKYPILLYLQGAYGVGGEVADLNHWGLPRLLRDETDLSLERNRLLLDEFVVINLHIRNGAYHQQPHLIREILERVAAQYHADLQRVVLTGLSRGGHASWALPTLLPNTFAAVAPVGGDAEDVQDFRALGETAIWVAHNQSDRTVPYAGAQRAAQAVEALTGEAFLRLTPNQVSSSNVLDHRFVFTSSPSGGHDAWTDLYTSAEFYRWLLQQRLP